MLTTGQKVKESLLIFMLNISLPTADIYSDLSLIVKFSTKGHINYATFLLIPFLLNYILTWINWSRIDEQKRITWVACLLGCYPQVKAAQVIWYLWTYPEKAMEKKKKMERDVAEMEVFVEAVPTTMVMTFLMVRAVFSKNREDGFVIKGVPGSQQEYLFFFTFATSVLSASFGLAKNLKVGPCRVLGEGGALGGLATPRFLLLSLACGATLTAKGAALGVAGGDYGCKHGLVPGVLLTMATMFLPGFLLALATTFHSSTYTSFLRHPSLLLLPTFTCFTFASNIKWCSKKEKEVEVKFSMKATALNFLITLVGHVVYPLAVPFSVSCSQVVFIRATGISFTAWYLLTSAPPALLGLLATLLFLLTSRPNPQPQIELGVYKPAKPLVPYVARTNPNTGEEEVVPEVDEKKTPKVKKKLGPRTRLGPQLHNQGPTPVSHVWFPNLETGPCVWVPGIHPKFGSRVWLQSNGLRCTLRSGSQFWVPLPAPRSGYPVWDPYLGTQVWVPGLGPSYGTQVLVPGRPLLDPGFGPRSCHYHI